MGKRRTVIADALESELALLAGATTETIGSPLQAVAELAGLVDELEPAGRDALSVRRRRAAARRLAAHAVLTAACVHGAFADRPDVDRARARVLSSLEPRGRRTTATPDDALAAVRAAALKLPAAEDDEQADWQLRAIAFVDERHLRALYDACVELAAVALREAAAS